MKLNHNREIGRLYEVQGNYAKAYLTIGAKDRVQFSDSKLEPIGKVGQHVVISSGLDRIVARISRVLTEDPAFKLGEKTRLPIFPEFITIMELILIGTITNKMFERGIRSYPAAEDVVCSISDSELKLMFVGSSDRDSLSVGHLAEAQNENVSVDIERLFQTHFSVLGSTGSGKTCTLIHLIHTVLRNSNYKSPHFLILDPHGEYGKAFDAEEFSDQVIHRKIGAKAPIFDRIKSESLDLPHYFFNFTEYKAFFRPAPQVQEPSLREAIGKTRLESTGEALKNADENIAADEPIPFEINELYGRIFGRGKRSKKDAAETQENNTASFLGSLGHRIMVTSKLPELKFIFHPKDGPKKFEKFRDLLLGFDDSGKFHKVTILDLSDVPRMKNLLVIVTNLLGRIVFDYLRDEEVANSGGGHCLIVLEEGHNFVPRVPPLVDKNSDYDYTLSSFETIAKEGRKYGACMAISSQRPRDLSETVLSQCGTHFIHRLSNMNDKNIIRAACSEVDEDLLGKMPILKRQTCLIVGDAIQSSAEIRIHSLKYDPDRAGNRVKKIWEKEPQQQPIPQPAVQSVEDGTKGGASEEIPF